MRKQKGTMNFPLIQIEKIPGKFKKILLQHLGADVTAGGRVLGDCIECPFHQWLFNGETGKCVKGPSSEKVSAMLLTKKKKENLEMNTG